MNKRWLLWALTGAVSVLALGCVTPPPETTPELCQPGTYSDTGEVPCTPAPVGTFVDTAGATEPTPCPAGTTTLVEGSASSDACVSVVPVLSSIEPATGGVDGGDSLRLLGTNLAGTTVVDFGVVSVPVLSASDSVIEFTAPAYSGSPSVSVSVSNSGGTSNALDYSYLAPSIVGLDPVSGPVGTEVTVFGSDFTADSTVSIGRSSAPVVYESSTLIRFTVPTFKVFGPKSVEVTTPMGTSNSVSFNVAAVPTISSLTPAKGAPGTKVLITGTGFTPDATVDFGALAAANVLYINGETLEAIVPSGFKTAGGVDVTVTTAGGTSNAVVFGVQL